MYLFVGEHEQHSIPQLVLSQHSHQLFLRLADSFPVITVYYEDEAWQWRRGTVGCRDVDKCLNVRCGIRATTGSCLCNRLGEMWKH